MKISVVIPVFNGESYLEKCLMSVAGQSKVEEIILVDDGSVDGSLEIAQEAAGKLPDLILKQHPGGSNRGRSASRNLGIETAKCDWISFLDADDWYLPDRFTHLPDANETSCAGFYDPIATFYSDIAYKSIFTDQVTGVDAGPPPSELLNYLICRDDEQISLNGLVVRRRACRSIGGFDTSLETGEDTDFIWRLAARHDLCPGGRLKPVAMRRVHGNNTYFDEKAMIKNRMIFYAKWKNVAKEQGLGTEAKKVIQRKYRYYKAAHQKGILGHGSRLAGRLRKVFK